MQYLIVKLSLNRFLKWSSLTQSNPSENKNGVEKEIACAYMTIRTCNLLTFASFISIDRDNYYARCKMDYLLQLKITGSDFISEYTSRVTNIKTTVQ